MPSIDKKVIQLKNTADELLDPIPALAKPGSVGGIFASAKTEEMTQPIGIDENGALWTAPGGSAEVTLDPNGGLQNTSTGLSIKGDSTAQGGPGIVTGSTGTYSPISSDGKRGSIIGVSKTDQQTEAVGIGSDGKLYTKPIGSAEVTLDPNGGLQNESAGLGVKLDETVLFKGSGLSTSNNGLKVKVAEHLAIGGIVGNGATNTQSEKVGIDTDGYLVTEPIPSVSKALTLKIYVNSETGNDINDGTTKETAVQTLKQAFRLIPDVAGTVYIYATGEGEANAGFPYHAESVEIIGDETNGYTITSPLYFINCSNVMLRNITFTNKTSTLINVKTDCYISLWNCTIAQTYDTTTTPEKLSLIKANANIGKVSVAIAGGSFNVNALCYSAQTLGHLEICLLTPNSASTIAKPLSRNNGSTPTGAIYIVTVPNKALMKNVTMPTIYAGARESYIVTGNNIELFSSDITIDETMLTNVYQKTISGFTISNIVHEADLLLYGTTAKQLYFNWDGEVLGTGAIMKGNFQGLGTISFNSSIYNCLVRINTNGNVKLYSTFDSQVTIPSGTVVTIIAKNINPGARL